MFVSAHHQKAGINVAAMLYKSLRDGFFRQRYLTDRDIPAMVFKKLLNISFNNGLETQMDIEGIKISQNAESPDGLEGLKAFSEKRKPIFNKS